MTTMVLIKEDMFARLEKFVEVDRERDSLLRVGAFFLYSLNSGIFADKKTNDRI